MAQHWTTNAGSWVPRALQNSAEGFTSANSDSPKPSSSSESVWASSSGTSWAESGPAGGKKRKEAVEVDVLAGLKKPKAEAPAPAAATASSEDAADGAKDEVMEGAPKLAQHIKSNAKFVKVANMATSLLEQGRVNRNNSDAFFEVLEAGVAEPKRIRQRELRIAARRLYGAAVQRKELFPPKRQAMLRLWGMRVVNQVDLYTLQEEQFCRITKEIRHGLLLLPCLNPSDEPPARSGAPREHMPEAARGIWAESIFECLEVALLAVNPQRPWAQQETNMLIKTAFDRRQNFCEEHAKMLAEWDVKRKDTSRQELIAIMSKPKDGSGGAWKAKESKY